MKVFKAAGMTREDTERALGEAILLSKIGHPNIIRVFDANVVEKNEETRGFFTMEYVAGGGLDQLWRSYGSKLMPVETAVEIGRQVCRGLSVAHGDSPPIIHRDIKPQNVLVGYDGNGLRVRISDFGLAKHVNPLTLLASARGTRGFKAPETWADVGADSCSGDVWAVGAMLYLLLTDRLPYPELAGDEPVTRPIDRPPLAAGQLNVQIDAALDQILLRSLSPRPQDRYRTAAELLTDLELWRFNPAAGDLEPRAAPSVPRESKIAISDAEPEEMAARALRLAREPGRLADAADLLEQAIFRRSGLKERYEGQLRLWRRGILM